MDTTNLIQILTTNKGEQFIIDVLNEVNNKDLNDLEKIILRDLLKVYYKICENNTINKELDKIIKKIDDENIKLKDFNMPIPIAIINLGKTPINYVPISTKYIHYTYKVFVMVVDDVRFKNKIMEQLFGDYKHEEIFKIQEKKFKLFSEDEHEETFEIQEKRFKLYKDIYSSNLITDEKLKINFKKTIEKLFSRKFLN